MSPTGDGFIRLALVLPFIRHIEQLGTDSNPALSSMGLTMSMLRDQNATAHAEIIYGLCNALADTSGKDFLGCEVGQHFDLHNWHPFSAAAQGADSVVQFLCNLIQQVPQESSSVRHSLSIDVERASYVVHRLVSTLNPPRQVDGFGVALHLRILEAAVGHDWNPNKVLVESAYPDAIPPRFRGVRIRKTEQPLLSIAFPSKWLGAKLAVHSPSKKVNNRAIKPDMSIISALRSAARPHLWNNRLNSKDLAKELGLDVRRFEKALRLHQTTATRELKRLKIDVAKEALKESKDTVASIGRDLGYADQSHFSRFFRSQTGLSPQEYRSGLDGEKTQSTPDRTE